MENGIVLKFETLYGWKTSDKYLVPVEYSPIRVVSAKGRVIQEYDNTITKEDILNFETYLKDLAMEGIMIGEAPKNIINEAEKRGIEIRESEPKAKLKIRVISRRNKLFEGKR